MNLWKAFCQSRASARLLRPGAIIAAIGMLVLTVGVAFAAPPDRIEISKFLVIGMKNGEAFNTSNTELGADRIVLSNPSDIGTNCPTDGGFPNLADVFGDPSDSRWDITTNPDSFDQARGLFQGIDYSGEVALTSSGGTAAIANSVIFAPTGIQAANTSTFTFDGNSKHSPSGFTNCNSAATLQLGDGYVKGQDFANLLTELGLWKAYIEGAVAEHSITSDAAWDDDGNVGVDGVGGLLTNYDAHDGNNGGVVDGIVIIDILLGTAQSPEDFDVNNTDWVLTGEKFYIFRLKYGSNMNMSNASILCGDLYPTDVLCSIFYSGYETSGGDTVFSGNNTVFGGIAFWDLNQVGDGGVNPLSAAAPMVDDTKISTQNSQGCAQFISQEVKFSDTRYSKCTFGTTTAIGMNDFAVNDSKLGVTAVILLATLLLIAGTLVLMRRRDGRIIP